jgi:hypothetical protein
MEQLGGRSRVISRADSRACFNLQVGSSDAVTMQGDTHLPGNLHYLPELLNSCRGLEQLFPPLLSWLNLETAAPITCHSPAPKDRRGPDSRRSLDTDPRMFELKIAYSCLRRNSKTVLQATRNGAAAAARPSTYQSAVKRQIVLPRKLSRRPRTWGSTKRLSAAQIRDILDFTPLGL